MRVSFKLTIESGNAAFSDCPREEVSRIIDSVSDAIQSGRDGGWAMDYNGNKVGSYDLEIEDDEE